MKNIMSYLIVVFSLFGTQLAQAIPADCESGPVKLSDLKYVGTDLKPMLRRNGACTVVPAYTDNDGRKACGEKRAALNPGNPQYTGVNDHGSQINNKLGYYFCVAMNKHQMCNERIRELSGTMDITWKQTGSSERNDGDCVCRRKGDTTAQMLKCPVTEEQVDAFKEGASTGCTIKGSIKEGNKCVCDLNREIEAKKDGDCPAEAPKQETAEVKDTDFDECFADIVAAKESCSQKGQDAINKCNKDAPETNKNIQEAQRVLSIGLDALVAKNAGTGALESCAKMSAAGTGVIEALGLLRENCKKELDQCKKGCEEVKDYAGKDTTTMMNSCKEKLAKKNPPVLWSDAHSARFTTLADQYKTAGANAEKFCKGDAQVADNGFDGLLQDLAASVQKADICKCQLTAGSVNTGLTGDKCDGVASALTCMQNLNQPGCSFSSVGCQPGSTITGCRNPVTAINPGGSGLGMPASGFAGPGFSSGGGTAAGKVNVGDADFSGLYDDARPTASATPTADNGSPFGSAAGSGGGGLGGGGGGGEGSGGGAKEGEGSERSGLSGFFNNAKGAVMSMFGNGGDKGSTMKKPDSKSFKNDVNGFRPKGAVRGMANAGEVGGKNRDIWKTMNERYTDQYHTFITVESPSK